MQKPPKKRDESIDAMKFLLICFVIFDHCYARFGLHVAPNYEHIYQVFQAINMPIFVFISGYFMRRTAERKKFYKGILGIFETYIVFQIPNFLYFVSKGDYNPLHLILPGWAMWYLPALIIWRVAAYELPEKIISNKALFIVILFLLSLASGFIPLKDHNIQRIFTFAPLFFIGFYCGKTTILNKVRKVNPLIPMTIIISYLVFLFIANLHTTPLFLQNITYHNHFASVSQSLLIRVVWHIIGLIIGTSATSLLLRVKNKKLAEMGMHTLLFYVGHIVVLTVCCPLVKKLGLLQPNPFYMMVMFCLIIAFFTILSKCKWHKYILNPITTYIDQHQ